MYNNILWFYRANGMVSIISWRQNKTTASELSQTAARFHRTDSSLKYCVGYSKEYTLMLQLGNILIVHHGEEAIVCNKSLNSIPALTILLHKLHITGIGNF
jgi:hypothetical protein